MKKILLTAIMALVALCSMAKDAMKWDEKHATFYNYTKGYSWELGTGTKWEKTETNDKNQEFAMNNDMGFYVVVSALEHSGSSEIWSYYDKIKTSINKATKKIGNKDNASITKCTLNGEHAICITTAIDAPAPVDKFIITNYRLAKGKYMYSISVMVPENVKKLMGKHYEKIQKALFDGWHFSTK